MLKIPRIHRIAGVSIVLLMAVCNFAMGATVLSDISSPKEKNTVTKAGSPKSWVYWLQHPEPKVIAASSFDLAVIDMTQDGRDRTMFSREDISLMQSAGKTVLCYLSIGEAEDYRWYWKPEWADTPPAFLGPENPDWEGNFKVKYWDEDWWELAVRPALDKIIALGFDGVYLDIVDAYWFWHEEGMELATTADAMVRLVERIARYLRAQAGEETIICPQNGIGILEDATAKQADRYLRTISMVGVESLLYNTEPETKRYRVRLLRRVAELKKPVLGVEYIFPEQEREYLGKARALPFTLVPYRADEDAGLERLVPQLNDLVTVQ